MSANKVSDIEIDNPVMFHIMVTCSLRIILDFRKEMRRFLGSGC